MGITGEGPRHWQPLEWFFEGWHNTFDKRAVASNPERFKAMEQIFGPAAVQPGWIVELEEINETNFPESLHQITEVLAIYLSAWLREERDLDGCGSFLRGCAAYGIVTNNYFHGQTTLPSYRAFIERLRTQLMEAGATLAEQELANTIDHGKLEGQLIVMTPNGIEHRQELLRRQEIHPVIDELDFASPHSVIFEMGTNRRLAYIRAHDGTILAYPIGLGNYFALGCSSTGRFNPFGLGSEELWNSQRYFPLIGSLTKPTDEIENGLSWWRIKNPQILPLQVGIPDSTY